MKAGSAIFRVIAAVGFATGPDMAEVADAQQAQPSPLPAAPASLPGAATPTLQEPTGPIENGKDLQPRGAAAPGGSADASQLLHQGAASPAAKLPPVPPKDLYGNPLGGSPGLDPPDPKRPAPDQAAPDQAAPDQAAPDQAAPPQ